MEVPASVLGVLRHPTSIQDIGATFMTVAGMASDLSQELAAFRVKKVARQRLRGHSTHHCPGAERLDNAAIEPAPDGILAVERAARHSNAQTLVAGLALLRSETSSPMDHRPEAPDGHALVSKMR